MITWNKKIIYSVAGFLILTIPIWIFAFNNQTSSPIEATLSSKSSTIKKAELKNQDVNDLNHVTITLSYSNKSRLPVTGLKAWIKVVGTNSFGVTGSDDVKIDEITTKQVQGFKVFDIPDIGAHENKSVNLIFYNFETGIASIEATLVNAAGNTVSTKQLSLTTE